LSARRRAHPGAVETHELLHTPSTRLSRLEALTVVVGEHPMPAWVARWCRRTDRPVRVRSATDPLDRIEVIATLAGSSVLVPHPDGSATSAPGPVVAAVRDLPDDDAVLAEATSAAEELGRPLMLAHVVPLSFAERSVRLDDAVRHGQRVLDRAVAWLAVSAPELPVMPRLLRRRPYELVGEELNAALLVLGGPRPGFPARIGLVASSALHHAHCSVLLAPRPGPDQTAFR